MDKPPGGWQIPPPPPLDTLKWALELPGVRANTSTPTRQERHLPHDMQHAHWQPPTKPLHQPPRRQELPELSPAAETAQVTKQVPDTYKEGEDALDTHGGDVYSFEEPLHPHHLPTVPHPSSPHVGRSPTLHPLTMAGRRSPSPSTQLLQPTLSPASPNTPVSSLIIEKQITPDVPLTSSEIESHVAEYISSGFGSGQGLPEERLVGKAKEALRNVAGMQE
ncbi:hypothetical protein DUNSADRAFT_5475 [Dunaliella salina]|uniref:Encoded protein n=1 Tax=Dunaliella salina TaxID=3046 RepID=A0ABQ7H780_DUNSA|nr:hypothetical protein DUNSADRAFT_5475 [Dunaliella salina]|eukprot:KAF5842708.1 hypothetical protein DUNSADRAFT_5475 [Dunaliella salina]